MTTLLHTQKSTIVRARDWRITALRLAFAALDRTAPQIAGPWALRMWCTVPNGSARQQDNRPAPGRRADVEYDGHRVATEIWEPEGDMSGPNTGKTIYLVHGWAGWRGQLGAFVVPLLDVGYRVVAFDVPSHGDSSAGRTGPGRSTAVEFIEALTEVSKVHGAPDGVVAHSLGCTTTGVAVRDGLRTGRLVFIAPGVDPIGSTQQMETILGYGPRTRQHFLKRLSRLARRPLDDFNLLLMKSTEDVPPALVIHDRDDTKSPYDDGVRLAETWPEAELVSTDGLGHQRILLDEGVIKTAVDYLATGSPGQT